MLDFGVYTTRIKKIKINILLKIVKCITGICCSDISLKHISSKFPDVFLCGYYMSAKTHPVVRKNFL